MKPEAVPNNELFFSQLPLGSCEMPHKHVILFFHISMLATCARAGLFVPAWLRR